jgi:hypothetical protein
MAELENLKGGIRLSVKPGWDGTKPLSIPPSRQGQIELQQHGHQTSDRIVLLGNGSAELRQDPTLLFSDPTIESGKTIAKTDHRLRFNENSVSRRRAVVNHSWTLGGGTSLHRQHRSTMAFRNDGVLQQGCPAPQNRLQTITPLLPSDLPLEAQLFQRFTRSIRNAPTLFQGKFQPLLKLRKRRHVFQQSRTVRP